MLTRHTTVSAVNIGAANTTAVIVDIDSDGVMAILGYGQCKTEGMANDLITDIRGLGGSISESVSQAEEMAEMRAGALVMAVGGEHVRVMKSRGGVPLQSGGRSARSVDRGDMKRALENAGAIPVPSELQVLHVLPLHYLVDGRRVRNPEDINGTRLDAEVMVVAAKQSVLRSLAKAAEYGGVRIGKFYYRPLATSRAVLSDEELDQGSCLIDIGDRHTDVALFREGKLVFSSTLRLGGGNITDDTGHMLSVNGSEAEKIKLQYGYCGTLAGEDVQFQVSGAGGGGALWRMARKSVIGPAVIQPRVEEIMQEARAVIDDYVVRESWPGGAVLTGGTSRLNGISEIAAEVFSLPVVNGGNIGFDNLDETCSSPQFSAALGLVAFDGEQRRFRSDYVRNNRISRWCGQVIRRINTVL